MKEKAVIPITLSSIFTGVRLGFGFSESRHLSSHAPLRYWQRPKFWTCASFVTSGLVLTRAMQPHPCPPISTPSNAWGLLPSLPFLPPRKQTSAGIFSDQAGVIQQLIGGLPRGLRGKEYTCQWRRHGYDPWVRKIPLRRKWQPTPVFLPGKSHGQRNLADDSPWGYKELHLT